MDDTESTTAILDGRECWELVRASEVGRLGVVIDGAPDIFPVNFVVDHGTVVFRTAPGAKMVAAIDAPVAFEVDGEVAGEAWSVVIKGRAEEIARNDELFDAAELPLYPWNIAPKHRFVRIVPESVSGRRFAIQDRAGAHADQERPRRAPIE